VVSILVNSSEPDVTSHPDFFQNYPNPFNQTTRIQFTLLKPDRVLLTVYDISGKEIGRLVNSRMDAGTHILEWNTSNYSSGTYLIRFEAGGNAVSKKVIIMK
jgi:hypothetical protein